LTVGLACDLVQENEIPFFSLKSPHMILPLISVSYKCCNRKKIQLEADKQQRDADLRIRSGEVQTLQKEYEAISSTNQQLERQRGKYYI